MLSNYGTKIQITVDHQPVEPDRHKPVTPKAETPVNVYVAIKAEELAELVKTAEKSASYNPVPGAHHR